VQDDSGEDLLALINAIFFRIIYSLVISVQQKWLQDWWGGCFYEHWLQQLEVLGVDDGHRRRRRRRRRRNMGD
jgi:hypothetical protein